MSASTRQRQWDTIRCLVMGFPDIYNELKLSERQVDLLRHINFIGGECVSTDVQFHLDCTIENASLKLRELYRKGYLTRHDKGHESGGTEYLYKLPPELAKTWDKE